MNEIMYTTLVFIAGFGLGSIFFGGLWVTVKKAVNAKTPAVWFLGSFILRVCIVMLGFYYISPGGWQPLSVSLFGFISARFIFTIITKAIDKKPAKTEVYHEA